MRDSIRVVVVGTGQIGSGIARLVLEKPGLELVGAFARRAQRAGMDLGPAIGLNRNLGIPVSVDLERLLDQCQPDVAIQATCSTTADAVGEIATLLSQRINVISIAEQMANPKCSSPAIAEELHWQAVNQGASVLGTGINPGFVLDLLVITLTGVCAGIQSIHASRINDLSPYGVTVLRSQGVGLSPQAFEQGVANGTVVGHYGFPESIHMIAKAVGWDIDSIEETREAIVSQVQRETPFVTVSPGQVAGCNHTAVGFVQSEPVIHLQHPQQIHPHLEGVQTGDRIEIKGTPGVCLSGSPEIPGGQGTMALAVNCIPRVLNAPPGLYTMADLPVPAAMLADARRFLPEELVEVKYESPL